MLEADKSKWFEKIFAVYNKSLLKRRFNSLYIHDLENLTEKNPQIPLIIYANHSGWWDGLIAFQISQRAKLDSYIMMEEKQLKKLFLFRKLGAFSVVRENPRWAIESLNYSVNILKSDFRRTLWIFPQGEILPNDVRPLHFYRGLAKIIEKTGECRVVPMAIRYEFLGSYKPEIFVSIGQIQNFSQIRNFDKNLFTEKASEILTSQLDALKSDIINSSLNNYEKII